MAARASKTSRPRPTPSSRRSSRHRPRRSRRSARQTRQRWERSGTTWPRPPRATQLRSARTPHSPPPPPSPMPRSAAAQCRDRWSHSRRVSREVAHFRCGRRSRSISFLTKPASALIHAPGRRHAGPKKSSIRRFSPRRPSGSAILRARLARWSAGRGAGASHSRSLARASLAARLGCRRCLRRLRLGALTRRAAPPPPRRHAARAP